MSFKQNKILKKTHQ